MDPENTFADLKKRSQNFIQNSQWSKFHSPKNIAVGIAVEAAELLDTLQCLTVNQSFIMKSEQQRLEKIKHETADILHFLIRLANILNFDLVDTFYSKMEENEKKYATKTGENSVTKYPGLPHAPRT